jgi:hypothetical protein
MDFKLNWCSAMFNTPVKNGGSKTHPGGQEMGQKGGPEVKARAGAPHLKLREFGGRFGTQVEVRDKGTARAEDDTQGTA